MQLTSDNVVSVFEECLTQMDGVAYIDAKALRLDVKFNSLKLELHRKDIITMLAELPQDFCSTSKTQGASFLNMCMRDDDVQWTGTHAIMDMLTALGLAAGYVSFILPREMWKVLPGGMPYIRIDCPTLNLEKIAMPKDTAITFEDEHPNQFEGQDMEIDTDDVAEAVESAMRDQFPDEPLDDDEDDYGYEDEDNESDLNPKQPPAFITVDGVTYGDTTALADHTFDKDVLALAIASAPRYVSNETGELVPEKEGESDNGAPDTEFSLPA